MAITIFKMATVHNLRFPYVENINIHIRPSLLSDLASLYKIRGNRTFAVQLSPKTIFLNMAASVCGLELKILIIGLLAPNSAQQHIWHRPVYKEVLDNRQTDGQVEYAASHQGATVRSLPVNGWQ